MRKVLAPAETERALAALWVAVAVAEEPVSEAVFELVLEALEEAELLLEAALVLELAVPVVLVLRVVELPEAARRVVSKMISFLFFFFPAVGADEIRWWVLIPVEEVLAPVVVSVKVTALVELDPASVTSNCWH